MSDIQAPPAGEQDKPDPATAFAGADRACPFGPSFFLGHLGKFVRDRCPDSKEQLPMVEIHLTDGERLELCHIIGVSPRWVVLAVRDPASHPESMALELVPYELIRRIHVRTRRAEGAAVGFRQTHSPEVIASETLLRAAMAAGGESG